MRIPTVYSINTYRRADLSVYSQEELDAIADSLNTRPRETLNARTPLEAYADVLKKAVPGTQTLQ